MKDLIREQFEQAFPLPDGVSFDGDHYVADPAVMGAFTNATVWSHMFRGWRSKDAVLPVRTVAGVLDYADMLLSEVNGLLSYCGSTAQDRQHDDSDYLALRAMLGGHDAN